MPASSWYEGNRYLSELEKVLKKMPHKDDARYAFMVQYKKAMVDYALIALSADILPSLIRKGVTDIDYNALEEELKKSVLWSKQYEPASGQSQKPVFI
jgi:hypothetical protein